MLLSETFVRIIEQTVCLCDCSDEQNVRMEKCLISLNGSLKRFQLHIMSITNNQSVHLDTVLNYLHLRVFI